MLKKKPKYKDQPLYPQIAIPYEDELIKEYDNMLIQMNKDIIEKLKKILP